MKKSKYAYCDMCDKDVTFNIIEEMVTIKTEDVGELSFLNKKAVCKHCGNEVNPVSYTHENIVSMHDAHKKKLGLLTSKEIKEIRKKLGLTQSKMSKLLGIGEKNIARYENGEWQIKAIDNAIRQLAEKYDKSNIKLNQQIGELLTKARKESNISIEDLSRESNIAKQDIIRIEEGKGDPTLSKITKLFNVLGKNITISLL